MPYIPCPHCDYKLSVDTADNRKTIWCRCGAALDVDDVLERWRCSNTRRMPSAAWLVAALVLGLWLLALCVWVVSWRMP
jgi:hypothetical protein